MNIHEKLNRTIVVFGTGEHAARCSYALKNIGIAISYYLNNNKKVDFFCGRKVYSPDKDNVRGVFIIVAVREGVYLTIQKQLQELGLCEFCDFLYYKWIDKKMVLVHGNCHTAIIKKYLESSDVFSKSYAIYPIPEIHRNKEGRINDIILKNCDILIHQDIQPNNQFGYFLSDEYICKRIKPGVKEIIIPNLFGIGQAFFPLQAESNRMNNAPLANGQDINAYFPYKDSIIEKCVYEGKNAKEIIDILKSDTVLERDLVIDNFLFYMNKVKEREKNWDIKIYDFIMQNYRKEKLFYDIGHPSNALLKQISKGILQMIGIEDDNIYTEVKLNAYEIPVYFSVKKYLGIEWNDLRLRDGMNTKKMCEDMDFDEYVYEYLWWCYGISDTNTIHKGSRELW